MTYRTVRGIETVRHVSSKGRHVSTQDHQVPKKYREFLINPGINRNQK